MYKLPDVNRPFYESRPILQAAGPDALVYRASSSEAALTETVPRPATMTSTTPISCFCNPLDSPSGDEGGSSGGESVDGEMIVFGDWASFYACGGRDRDEGRDRARRHRKRRTSSATVEYCSAQGMVFEVEDEDYEDDEDEDCQDKDRQDEDQRDEADANEQKGGHAIALTAEPSTTSIGADSKPTDADTDAPAKHEVAFIATLSAMSIGVFDDSARDEFAAGVATSLGVPRDGVRVTGALAGSVIVKTSVSVAGGAAAASALASSLADSSAAGLGPLVDEVRCDGMAT